MNFVKVFTQRFVLPFKYLVSQNVCVFFPINAFQNLFGLTSLLLLSIISKINLNYIYE